VKRHAHGTHAHLSHIHHHRRSKHSKTPKIYYGKSITHRVRACQHHFEFFLNETQKAILHQVKEVKIMVILLNLREVF
jgi:hypothetical protein